MANNEVEIIDGDIIDLTSRPQNNGGLLDANTDNILYLADKAEQYIEAMNRIMDAALRITNELDWVLSAVNRTFRKAAQQRLRGCSASRFSC